MAGHRRPSQWDPAGSDPTNRATTRTRVTVLSTAAATAATLAAVPANADPQDNPAATRAEVTRLYEQAERATEAYNKADERAEALRRQVSQAQDSVARGQQRINTMRGALGSLAGAQYRSGGIDPMLALMLSENPDGYLEKAAALERITARHASQLAELQGAQRALAQERAEAGHQLADLQQFRSSAAKHKRTVERKLAKAQRLLNSLSPQDRAAYEHASRSGRDDLPPLTEEAPASARAAVALAAVRQAVGRPYVWGASGPNGFDCSGLTQWAYWQAGVGLPRTSQAQRFAGRQITLDQAEPGDLVTYRDDASHIGMYMGGGQVVHAPYPGAPVRYDPVGMMPISAVTRV